MVSIKSIKCHVGNQLDGHLHKSMVSMTQIEHAGNILKSHAAMYQYFTYQNCSEFFETQDDWDCFVESCKGDFAGQCYDLLENLIQCYEY